MTAYEEKKILRLGLGFLNQRDELNRIEIFTRWVQKNFSGRGVTVKEIVSAWYNLTLFALGIAGCPLKELRRKRIGMRIPRLADVEHSNSHGMRTGSPVAATTCKRQDGTILFIYETGRNVLPLTMAWVYCLV